MIIAVSTCNKYRHLVYNFARLFNRFWDEKQEVLVFGYLPSDETLPDNFRFISLGQADEPWSTQTLKILDQIPEEQFIFLREDFYLLKPVPVNKVKSLWDFMLGCRDYKRIGLQSFNDYAPEEKTMMKFFAQIYTSDIKLWRMGWKSPYICSFEASIFRKDFLQKYMIAGESSQEAENNTSARARQDDNVVLIPEETILYYKDAFRGGREHRIEDRDGEIWNLTPDGWKFTGVKL